MTAGPEKCGGRCVLHACCGPCASHCLTVLMEDGYEPLVFYSNSNIFPEEEYLRRLSSLNKLAAALGVSVVADEYDHESWLAAVKGLEGEPEGGERCRRCFEFNLGRAREFAGRLGLLFTTSLTVSPHKNSRILLALGGKMGGFLPYDFKKKDGFLHSVRLAGIYGLYRQNYCGCEFSLAEGLERAKK